MSALVAASYLRGVLDVLLEYDETEDSANHTFTQVAVVALGTFIGAVFGGRTGAAVGGATSAVVSTAIVPDYKPLAQCITDMSPAKQTEIANKIQNRVGNPAIVAAREFARAAPKNVEWLKRQLRDS